VIRQRKVEPGMFVQVRDEEIPDWVKEVPAPERLDLAVFFTQARHSDPYGGPFAAIASPFTPYLDRLAARCHERIQQEHGHALPLLQLLDLVPWMLLHASRYPWLLETLFRLFAQRGYPLFGQLEEGLCRRPSDSDQTVLYFYRLLEQVPFPTELARLHALGQALRPVRTADGIRKAVERARQASMWRPLFRPGEADARADPATGAESGAQPGGPPSAATVTPCTCARLGADEQGQPVPHLHCACCDRPLPLEHPGLERLVLTERPEPGARRKDYGHLCGDAACREQIAVLLLRDPPPWRPDLAELDLDGLELARDEDVLAADEEADPQLEAGGAGLPVEDEISDPEGG